MFARVFEKSTGDGSADTTRLPLVRDGDCELGTQTTRRSRIPGHADDALLVTTAHHSDECHRMMKIYVHHAFHEFFGRLANREHEPAIARGRAQAANELAFAPRVFRADRANDVVDG